MSENDDLNRLKRTGDEASKTNKKLIEAAQRVADFIAQAFANIGPCVNGDVELGREYFVRVDDRDYGRSFLVHNSRTAHLIRFTPGQFSRAAVLRLADDLAGGWLNELLAKLEAYWQESKRALAVLDSSGDALDEYNAKNSKALLIPDSSGDALEQKTVGDKPPSSSLWNS